MHREVIHLIVASLFTTLQTYRRLLQFSYLYLVIVFTL